MCDSMTAPESLLTPRLALRKPRPEDAGFIFASYGRDSEVTRYLTWRPHPSVRDAEAAVQRFLEGWQRGTTFSWLIFDRETGELAGSLAARKDETGFNLGYLLARSYWGRGLMVEAIEAVVNWAFTDPTVFRIWAICDCENGASARVLEKAGFQREGVLRRWSIHPNVSEIPRDCFCYARIRED